MKYLIVLLGPTGVGKTDLSIDIANEFNTQIISSDSRQVYKELKIGTAVPSIEQLEAVKHHLIGHKSIYDYYNASMFEFEVLDILEELYKEKKAALLVGGSGMYIDAVCNGIDELPTIDTEVRENLLQKYEEEGIDSLRFMLKHLDPVYYSEVDLMNAKRILKGLEVCIMTGKPYSSFCTKKVKERPFTIIKIGLVRPRTELYPRIDFRVDEMIREGLLNETEFYYKDKSLNSLNTVGYKEFFAHYDGEYDLEKAIELVKRNSRRYAKRQISWFKRDKNTAWFHPEEKNEIIDYINKTIENQIVPNPKERAEFKF